MARDAEVTTWVLAGTVAVICSVLMVLLASHPIDLLLGWLVPMVQ